MSKYKYLRIMTNDMIWGKQELSGEYFISVVESDDILIDLDDMTYLDSESNSWKDIPGDSV